MVCTSSSSRDDLSDMSRKHVIATYLYFLLKILDLLDTVSSNPTLPVLLPIYRRFFIFYF